MTRELLQGLEARTIPVFKPRSDKLREMIAIRLLEITRSLRYNECPSFPGLVISCARSIVLEANTNSGSR